MTETAEAMSTIDIIAVNATQVTNAIDHLRALVYAAHDRIGEANAETSRAHRQVAEMQAKVQAATDALNSLSVDEYTKRLESALHERLAHPDFEYATTTGPRKAWDGHPPERGNGPEWEANTDYHGGWERFEYHEECYWRRRRIKPESECPVCFSSPYETDGLGVCLVCRDEPRVL